MKRKRKSNIIENEDEEEDYFEAQSFPAAWYNRLLTNSLSTSPLSYNYTILSPDSSPPSPEMPKTSSSSPSLSPDSSPCSPKRSDNPFAPSNFSLLAPETPLLHSNFSLLVSETPVLSSNFSLLASETHSPPSNFSLLASETHSPPSNLSLIHI